MEILRINLKPIFITAAKIGSVLVSLFTIILTCISWDDIGIESKCTRFGILLGVILASILMAALYVTVMKRTYTAWQNGNSKICVCYDDLLKIAFPKRAQEHIIVVIPVNTCFDTIVDSDIASVKKPLVSIASIHGQWIKKMLHAGVSQTELNNKIYEYLTMKGIAPIKDLSEAKERGNPLSYPEGTIAVLNGKNNVTFFLLAIAEFDEDNKAQSSKNTIINCVNNLINSYDDYGQGYKLYVPLMGTGRSRANLTHQESLHTIRTMFELYCNKLHGEVNIVVFSKDKNKVSLSSN